MHNFWDVTRVTLDLLVILKFYMPNKRHSQFGIKKFELCESVTGYVLHVELYAGKDFPIHRVMGEAHGVMGQAHGVMGQAHGVMG